MAGNHNHFYENWNYSLDNISNKYDVDHFNLSSDALIGLTILYAFTTILAIVGNLLVVVVFIRGKRSRTDLRHFLINLAIADLLMGLFCMPFTFADAIYNMWIFSKPVCPIVLSIQIISVAASVFTNMAIAVDRFLVVTHPLKHRFTQERSKYIIFVIWTAATALSCVQFFVGRAHVDEGSGHLVCDEIWPSKRSRKIYTITVLLSTYIIPLVIITVAYVVVGFLLWKRTPPGNRDHFRDFLQWRSKIKVVKMLVIVVTIFGVCWLPLHVFTLVRDFHPSTYHDRLELGLYLGVHWLAMSNSFANPIIYSFTNDSFRADLLTLFYMWCPCCSCLRVMINRTYSVTTKESFLIRHQSKPKKSSSAKLQKRLLIVEQTPGCTGSRNKTCEEEQLDLVCKLFVDSVSELGTAQVSSNP
ncbi:substance-K receptor-like [Saccostrea cucullata]|uniref:substance-K receptor-like n=1 Tax=Saccostrea cuccullata TaxID=36930 RepID=UPI002ED365A8